MGSDPHLAGVTWFGEPTRALRLPAVSAHGSSWLGGLKAAAALRRAHAEIVLVSGTDDDLARAAWVTTLGGARAVLLFPTGEPRALPRWERRFHRYVLADQEQARAWARVGPGLGRVFVVPEQHAEQALAALIAEVRSMAR